MQGSAVMTWHRACAAPGLPLFTGLFCGVWSGGTVGLVWGIADVTRAARHRDMCWEQGGRAKKLERHDAVIVLL